MKTQIRKRTLLSIASTAFLLLTVTSCKKDNSASPDLSDITGAIESQQAIAVAASTTTAGDSIYVVQTCARGMHRDSLAFSALPSTITSYLPANYDGYVFKKAFSVKNSSGIVQGYVVIIQFNTSPVGLKFDTGGNFISVLEQREGRDLLGRGWHEGGRFDRRNGRHKDTIALSSLPAAIATYFGTNAAQDTLLAAFKNCDSGYLVISKNNGLFATVFNASAAFIRRVQLPAHSGPGIPIAESALPANIVTYLTSAYPNYVFSKAFSIRNPVVVGFVVLIEANSTRYSVQFDASGNFIKAKTIH